MSLFIIRGGGELKVNTAFKMVDLPERCIIDISYPTSKLRRGRLQGGGAISPTITTSANLIFSEWNLIINNKTTCATKKTRD